MEPCNDRSHDTICLHLTCHRTVQTIMALLGCNKLPLFIVHCACLHALLIPPVPNGSMLHHPSACTTKPACMHGIRIHVTMCMRTSVLTMAILTGCGWTFSQETRHVTEVLPCRQADAGVQSTASGKQRAKPTTAGDPKLTLPRYAQLYMQYIAGCC